MEEARQAALEVAQEEDAPPEACPKDAQAVTIKTMGVWGNSVSSRAPVNWV